MPNNLENLWEIFSNKLFRIPDYQRGYAWQKGKSGQKSQLGEFWDDLFNLDDNREHYTGLLTLKELSKDDAEKILDEDSKGTYRKVYEVVDGQQRLTTAIILIKVLLEKKYKDNFEKLFKIFPSKIEEQFIREKKFDGHYAYIFGYAKDDPSYSCLRYEIFGAEKPSDMSATPDTYYTKNLKDAKKFFTTKVKQLSDEDAVKIYKNLVGKLMFNLHEINSNFDVFVSFETMNNRGKPLSNLELLKNRLIYLSVLFKDENLRNEITAAWREIYRRLGQNADKPIDDDEFLRAHWIAYFGPPRTKQKHEEISFLMNYFSSHRIENFVSSVDDSPEETPDETPDETSDEEFSADVVRAYVKSLSNLAKFYLFTRFPNLDDPANNLSPEEKIQLFLLNEVDYRYFEPLLMVACAKNSSAERLEFFKAVERFIFLKFVLSRRRSDADRKTYQTAARELNFDKTTFAALTKQLNEAANEEAAAARETFVNDIDRNFRDYEGFYTWGDSLRYFLLVYECELRKENCTVDALKKFAEECREIEHIFPKNTTPYWNEVFKNFDERQRNCLRHTLGNLLRLSKTDNLKVSDKNFKEKADVYVNSSQSGIEVAQKSQWTAAEILARSQELLDFMDKHWGLGLKDNAAQKKSLIHLDFMK